MKLNLGCSDYLLAEYVNVDIAVPTGNRVAEAEEFQEVDLRLRWPWATSSIDEIQAVDIIEHLPDKINTLNEAWRVLKRGGLLHVEVPTTDGPGAFQDPTHISYWNRGSFKYFEWTNYYRNRFAKAYGIEAMFKVRSESISIGEDGPILILDLVAVKADASSPD
jgi:SAM-dependent methyltransferase